MLLLRGKDHDEFVQKVEISMIKARAYLINRIFDFVQANPGCTRTDIVRAVEQTKSPYLRGVLDEMVTLGLCIEAADVQTGRLTWRYYLRRDLESGAL
jgi:hypothetical protein